MAEDAFVTDFEHIMADDITENVRFIMYDSESGKTASASEVRKYMMKNVHVDPTLTEEGSAAEAKAVGEALATKADTKGTYEDLIVGGAEQLMADEYETDKEPYLFRPTGGSADVGNREYLDKIVGGTVGWNQLQANVVSRTVNGITYTYSNGALAVSGTATGTAWWLTSTATKWDYIKDHVYLFDVGNNSYVGSTSTYMWYPPEAFLNTTLTSPIEIKKASSNASSYFQMYVASGYTANITFKPQVFDLTAMFGTTIADYIYSLEQATAGAGVSWFRNYFPNDYYAYDPGTLRSVEGVSAHETVGFNQWDEEWEAGDISSAGLPVSSTVYFRSKNFIPVLPKTEYYFNTSSDSVFVYCYDSNKEYISRFTGTKNRTREMPDGCSYIKFVDTVRNAYDQANNPICINISDPSRNGDYEPYTKHTYPLDSSLTLRGVPKLVDGKLAFDGDVYPPDGVVSRRFRIDTYDGSEAWTKDSDISSGTIHRFYLRNDDMKKYVDYADRMLANKCETANNYSASSIAGNFAVTGYSITSSGGNWMYIFSKTIDTVEGIKAWLAEKPLQVLYELATPTTETADGYEHYQICDPSGTEKFVTDSIVPVGHETRYPHDLKKKIETAPDSPSADGTYLMKRSGGKNTYMALPSTPSANGAYVLTVTVSGGSASYSWAAKE